MDDILIQSHHRKQTWNRCKFKHWIHYELRRRKPRNDINFIFGESIHDALRLYYDSNREIPFQDVSNRFELRMKVDTEDMILNGQIDIWTKKGITILDRYVKQTKEAETFKVLKTEHSFHLCITDTGEILSDSRDIPDDAFTVLAGKIDLLIDTLDGVYIVDHKTTSQSHDDFMNQFSIDEQLLDYSIWGRWMYGDKFKGVMVNGINKDTSSLNTIFRRWFSFTDYEIDYAIGAYLDSAQEYYILRQSPHLLQQREIQYDCQRCGELDVSMAYRKGEDFHQLLDLYYETIETFDWEE